MKKLLLAGFVCLAREALPAFLLQPIAQEPFHRAGPWGIELNGPVRGRTDFKSSMWLGIQISGLIQELTKSGRTARPHNFKCDGLLQRWVYTDQHAPVVGEKSSAFLCRCQAHQGLRQ